MQVVHLSAGSLRTGPIPGPSGDPPSQYADEDGLLDRLYGVDRPAVDGRPCVVVCMVASLDGSIAVDGRSGGLGNAGDRAVYAALRRAADVVLVGAATAAAEKYRPPRRPAQRIGVVTASGRVDTTTELFSSGAGFLVMPGDGPPTPGGIDAVRAGAGKVDIAQALRTLPVAVRPGGFVLCEGGPTLNGAVLDAGCLDELDLSIAPILAGGEGPRVTAHAGDARAGMRLAHVLTDADGYLFTRWVRGAA